jgi:hypothetical protein
MPGPLPSIAKPPGTIATVSRRFTGGAFSVGVARGALAFPARTGRSTGSMRRRSKILARHDADMAAARAAWRKRLPYASDLASGHRRAQKPPTAFNSEITQNINAPRARLAGRVFTRTIDGTPVGSERAFPFGAVTVIRTDCERPQLGKPRQPQGAARCDLASTRQGPTRTSLVVTQTVAHSPNRR